MLAFINLHHVEKEKKDSIQAAKEEKERKGISATLIIMVNSCIY